MEELTLRVGPLADCPPECTQLVEREYGPDSFYHSPAHALSVADLPGGTRTSRYNARRCERMGFAHKIIDRSEWEDDLFAVRSSARERQGREMPLAYLERQTYSHDPWPDEQTCDVHGSTIHSVVSPEGRVVAYAQVVQSCEVARVNTILGHDDYMQAGVVWLLVASLMAWHEERDADRCLYYTHDSGHGGGLRYFKERFGFRPARVAWSK